MANEGEKKRPNIHPVDRLATVRFQISELREEEAALKDEIIHGDCGMIGNDFKATVKETASKRFDAAGYRKHRGDAALKDWISESKMTALYVREIKS